MNKIAGGYAEIYKNNLFLDVVSDSYVIEGDKIEFSAWHTFAQKKSLASVDLLNAQALEGFDNEEFGINKPKLLRVFQSQKNIPSGLRVQLLGSEKVQAVSEFEQLTPILNRVEWGITPSIKTQYMTEIIEAFDGTEQRISLRDKPRLTADFQYSLFESDRYIFDNQFVSRSGNVLLPLWPLQVKCRVTDDGINLNTINEYLGMARFLVITDGVNSEVVTIDSRSDLAIECNLLVLKNSSEELFAIPAFPATPSNETISKIVSNFYETTPISFEIDPDSIEFSAPTESKYPSIKDRMEWGDDLGRYITGNSKPVLNVRYDRTADITANYYRLRESFDPGTGLKHEYDRAPGAYRVFNFEYKFFSEEDRQYFEDFAKITKGAQREFYCEAPYFGYEVISAGGNEILIKDSKLSLISSTSAPALTLSLYNGTRLYRKINSVTNNNDGTQTLHILESIPSLNSDDIEYAAPLFLSRFESDDFVFNFETDQISTITKTIKQLIHSEHTRY